MARMVIVSWRSPGYCYTTRNFSELTRGPLKSVRTTPTRGLLSAFSERYAVPKLALSLPLQHVKTIYSRERTRVVGTFYQLDLSAFVRSRCINHWKIVFTSDTICTRIKVPAQNIFGLANKLALAGCGSQQSERPKPDWCHAV